MACGGGGGRHGLMRIHVTGLQNARGGGKRRLWLVAASDLCYEEGRGDAPSLSGRRERCLIPVSACTAMKGSSFSPFSPQGRLLFPSQ